VLCSVLALLRALCCCADRTAVLCTGGLLQGVLHATLTAMLSAALMMLCLRSWRHAAQLCCAVLRCSVCWF
jgi:hypothetical protein